MTNWRGVKYPSTLENLDIIEENNPTLAINVLLAPADQKDEIVKKKSNKNVKGKKGGRQIPEEEEKGKFHPVTNVTNIRLSKKTDRKDVINLLMIHKV
jgi:hypothetical protein